MRIAVRNLPRHLLDARSWRPFTQHGFQPVQRARRSCNDELHTSIGAIPYPAGEVQRPRLFANEPAESDALNATRDLEVLCRHPFRLSFREQGRKHAGECGLLRRHAHAWGRPQLDGART